MLDTPWVPDPNISDGKATDKRSNSQWPVAPWAIRYDPESAQLIIYCVWKSAPPGLKAFFETAIHESCAELRDSAQSEVDWGNAGKPNENISCEEGDVRGQSKAKDEVAIDDANSCGETNVPLDRRASKSDRGRSCELGDLQGPFKANVEPVVDDVDSRRERMRARNSNE
ncbi:hypothetical protein B0A54_17772 [Friedmanniomyces endolithicus]|uniref:Uncharacterized protein n=1 Tax=Friedmanniomyces endolithicus TaxID=329885 RepID=A0A4U0TP66_9PEZI|nr:hypothetical protein B0A54_17772 [Friedmanniomyces endolithicus]